MSSENRIALFPELSLFIEDNDVNLSIIKQECLAYLNCLTERMITYQILILKSWIFLGLEISFRSTYKINWNASKCWCQIWVKQNKRNNILDEKALSVLLPFPSTYLCKTAFSTMAVMKTKYRNRIYQEYNLCCALTQNIVPNFDKLAESGQHHGSK